MPSPGLDVQSWSTTAINNGSADPSINFLENQARASLNDSMRGVMAAWALWRNLINGSITTGGAANAQTFASGVNYTSVPTGLVVRLKIGPALTNTGATTLNMDAIGAVAVQYASGAALAAGALVAGTYCEFVYNGTNWIFFAPTPTPLVPTTQSLTASGTYTKPANAIWIEVYLKGGGGGGGSNNSATAGSTGVASTFGSGAQLTAAAGVGGINSGGGGIGGTASGTLLTRIIQGQPGGSGTTSSDTVGCVGGAGGGNGGGAGIYSGQGSAPYANSGAGGSGCGAPQGGSEIGSAGFYVAGGGGGEGGTAYAVIAAPAASYAVVIGTGGAAGTNAQNGAAGYCFVVEHYI